MLFDEKRNRKLRRGQLLEQKIFKSTSVEVKWGHHLRRDNDKSLLLKYSYSWPEVGIKSIIVMTRLQCFLSPIIFCVEEEKQR